MIGLMANVQEEYNAYEILPVHYKQLHEELSRNIHRVLFI